MVGVLPIRIVKSNVSSVGPSSERNRGKNIYIYIFNGENARMANAELAFNS